MKKLLVSLIFLTVFLVVAAVVALAIQSSRMNMIFLSNDWCTWFWQNFSTVMALIPTTAFAVLQAIAVFHPGVESNGIFALVRKWANPNQTGPPEGPAAGPAVAPAAEAKT